MPAGHLLAADLTDGKGASYAVRHTPKGWVLTTMTRVASETAVLVRHVRLPRRNDGRVEFGNWQLEFEVCWTQVLDSKGERTLFPFASRFVGLI
ncbi:MAG: hypothetical protein HY303_11240 [Candidatus Wallbacteria bacterium]|nr:hypothetical protein [Candidatus Wallbacteria bacterium]